MITAYDLAEELQASGGGKRFVSTAEIYGLLDAYCRLRVDSDILRPGEYMEFKGLPLIPATTANGYWMWLSCPHCQSKDIPVKLDGEYVCSVCGAPLE